MKATSLGFLFILLTFQFISAQQAISIRINQPDDDIEEYISGANQTKVLGSMDIGSSDLELGMETKGNIDPQLIGMRFNSIAIPKGALITNAYLQFTVDNNNKNTDPCNLFIYAELSSNAVAFNTSQAFNLSSRNFIKDSIAWNIAPGTWSVIGENSLDQRSTNISSLIQQIVNQQDWNPGNSLALFIKGSGLREAESYDGSPADAPLLVIEFTPVLNLTTKISSPEDDIEEYLPGPNQTKVPGNMDIGSSDLELGMETAGNVDPQYIGLRFAALDIPKSSVIKSAYLQFTVDNTNKNTDPNKLTIWVENTSNAQAYNANDPFNLTKRAVLNDSIIWEIPNGSWTVIGQKGADQRSTDISKLVQQIVNQDNWTSGNAISFFIKGVGLREAESYDGSPADAAQLIIDYIPVAKSSFSVLTPEDDIEEYLPGPNQTKVPGNMDIGSSDLELGMETAGNVDPQYVGMRFANINLAKGTFVTKAYLQFTVDNTNKNTDPCKLTIWAEKSENCLAFNPNDPFNLTNRPVFSDSIVWDISAGSWTTIGEKSLDQQSVNISALINKILAQDNWTSGNALSLFIKGTGLREAESYDGSPSDAPKLNIEFFQSVKPRLPVTDFPLKRKSDWYYWDQTTPPPADWAAISYNDEAWESGPAPLGYGDPFIVTKLKFGPDANNKTISSYFRKYISIPNLDSLSNQIEFSINTDDGAVVYINGAEAFRINLPDTTIRPSTKAVKRILGNEERYFYLFDVPKSLFVNGTNTIAVEVHQWEGFSSDLSFDLEIKNKKFDTNPSRLGCTNGNDQHIACFTSLLPRAQDESIELPDSHAFQYIIATDDAYIGTQGSIQSNFDFTGYVPINGSSTEGYLSINHEKTIGGVSILDMKFNQTKKLWEVNSSGPVDFSPVVMTSENCSGAVTPWNTIITCEETTLNVDANSDGYMDIGWSIEIDPKTRAVKNYGKGPEKLWALGRMDHENAVVKNDRKTLYQGEDAPDGNVYKFIADQEGNLSAGKLYVLKLNGAIQNGEPTSSQGVWLEVPNTTTQERNDVKQWAKQNGATQFAGVEDVEINPLNDQVYFSVKGVGRVYRFIDAGNTVSGFETFVGDNAYRLNSNDLVVAEDWGQGNDNLTFDDLGNLWVLQDGGSNFVWVVRPDHTQTNPKVELFLQTPIGSEPTGMTFTPDYKYMFISIQEPSSANTVLLKDASGKEVRFNKSTTLVISRKSNLGNPVAINSTILENLDLQIYPNPFKQKCKIDFNLDQSAKVEIVISDAQGKNLYSSGVMQKGKGKVSTEMHLPYTGMLFASIYVNGERKTYKLIGF